MYIKFKVTEPVALSWLSRMWIQCSSCMQQYRDESEIYNYQRIRLWNNKFIKGILGARWGTLDLAWMQIQSMSIALYKAYNLDTSLAIHILSICNFINNVLYVCIIYIHIKVLYVKAGFRSGLAQSVELFTANTNTQGLNITEKWRYFLCPSNG